MTDSRVTKRVSAARGMVVAGVMSGTSADGVDVAICRISSGTGPLGEPRIELVGHCGYRYPKAVRAEVLRMMEGAAASAAEMSRLNWRLGEEYAGCVARAAQKFDARVDLVGLHGQTIFHGPAQVKTLGGKVRATWQIGEAAVVAEKVGCPVLSDLRAADMAAGGQGAPLVPMLDWSIFRSAKVSRVLQNLGGIGNLTAIPAPAGPEDVMAFDTGPGNMVIDECMRRLYGREMDRGGAVARRGQVLRGVVDAVMREPYFSALPPKSCGREEFGAAFAERFLAMCREAGGADADVIATATAVTAESVLDAYRRFVWAHVGVRAPLRPVEFCVAGGGAKNAALMEMLRIGFGGLGVRVRAMDELGVPAQAKEAVAFALLAWLAWHGRAGNIPSATGAGRAVVLGKISTYTPQDQGHPPVPRDRPGPGRRKARM